MVEIRKGEEPEELKALREEASNRKLTPHAAYDLLQNPEKKKVLEALKRDQGQLCVYCMSHIPIDDRDSRIMGESIEHFIPLNSEDVGQGLDYRNLFAVCHGNMKMRAKGVRRTTGKADLTCDKHREDIVFKKIDPLNPSSLQSITYTLDGKIGATDQDVEYDLVNTLNLNCPTSPLTAERKSALDKLIEGMAEIKENELYDYCTDALKAFQEETDPKTPYVGILIWYLKTTINALKERDYYGFR